MRESGEYLYVLLRRAARELEKLEAAALGRTRARLRPAYVPVLVALLDASPLTPGELSARCEAEPSTMTGLLRTLEERGLIARERMARDERTYAISLTPRGRAAARVATRRRSWAENAVLRVLPRGAGKKLRPLLGEVAAAARTLEASVADNPRAALKVLRRSSR